MNQERVGTALALVEPMSTSTESRPYSITLWGSNPDETDNDDCWTGDDFSTREEALATYREVVMFQDHPLARVCGPIGSWEYVMIDGPEGLHEVTQNPDHISCERRRRELGRSNAEWQRERAMEAGMLHGIEAYNDEMGY